MNTALVSSLLGKHRHPLDPPGCCSDFIEHPVDPRRAVEIGIVLQHRFAFSYWMKWHAEALRTGSPVPNLLTVDWHDDVGGDCDFVPEVLRQLDFRDENEVSFFCWAGLRSLNDGHIAPAQYLNAVGDVYVILKQHAERRAMHPEYRSRSQVDLNGQVHQIHYYDRVEDFIAGHGSDPVHPLILDLDLDYFTRPDKSRERHSQHVVADRTVRRFLAPGRALMGWVFPRLVGFTIALEPEYCGGIRNCTHILDLVSSTLCDPPLLRAGMRWRPVRRR